MGACFRTDETLPLPLSPYVWKILVGEQVTWEKDYVTVDEAAVRNMGRILLRDFTFCKKINF